jgi:glycerol dehydrogenase-like iron-containing ADH family enzyme
LIEIEFFQSDSGALAAEHHLHDALELDLDVLAAIAAR